MNWTTPDPLRVSSVYGETRKVLMETEVCGSCYDNFYFTAIFPSMQILLTQACFGRTNYVYVITDFIFAFYSVIKWMLKALAKTWESC